jgi:hypothetical protein
VAQPDKYSARAETARRAAEKAVTEAEREAHLALARSWAQLAKDALLVFGRRDDRERD